LVQWLKVGSDADTTKEARRLRRQAMEAALEAIRTDETGMPERVRKAVMLQYEGELASHDALHKARHGADEDETDSGDRRNVAELLQRAAEVEREMVIEARLRGRVSPEVADEVLADIENRAVRDAE
jgi:CPA1 family monovalent cation:H+ antiporter